MDKAEGRVHCRGDREGGKPMIWWEFPELCSQRKDEPNVNRNIERVAERDEWFRSTLFEFLINVIRQAA